MNINTSVRRGNEVLQVVLNVRALSNFAKLQKVPFTKIHEHLSTTLPEKEGAELEKIIHLIFCAIEEGFRYYKKPCPYDVDDIWDWFMSNEEEFLQAQDQIMKVIIDSVDSIPASEEQGKK